MASEYVSRKTPVSLIFAKYREARSWRDLCFKIQFAAMNDASNVALVIRVDDWRIYANQTMVRSTFGVCAPRSV
jgi:hypothetical protein